MFLHTDMFGVLLLDMFPSTSNVECLICLNKK